MKIKIDQEAEFDVLSLGECMNQLNLLGHQRIELIPVFEVHAGGSEYNVTCALARYGIRAN
jgi:sugar/nucleoside kinase (ribokinase family)